MTGPVITAVLGPTNTGKTHFAIERMLAHQTGMIGLPLRLLAREVYDRIVREKGRKAVALITGEEKIVPPYARYFVATVEAMPLERRVECLVIDEIQLAADPERGHIFTDRLLKARGEKETIFLGADTIRPLLTRLIAGIEIITRPRLSRLAYTGYKNLARLPRRTAIVAFSAADVYEIADSLRRHQGGTAVVLGALSPRTRNAQVALFESGEVDYLVATDAIGMGLNLGIDHIVFSGLTKFDGRRRRQLTPQEAAQIAGRAGRHMRNGTFGTTLKVRGLEADLVSAIEEHRFAPLTQLTWRNSLLDFSTPRALLRSLELNPSQAWFSRMREADDHMALTALSGRQDIADLARGRVPLLWEVCQIPDFRKTMSDDHVGLLGQIFRHLAADHRLPADWVAQEVDKLDHAHGGIDALMARLAAIRTWTFIANKGDWIEDSVAWQEKTRLIEDRLSDTLHETLKSSFVSARSASFGRAEEDGRALIGSIRNNGEVLVEGHKVGRLDGFRFVLDPAIDMQDRDKIARAARKALNGVIDLRVAAFRGAPASAFGIDCDGVIRWNGAPVARLARSRDILEPAIEISDTAFLDTDRHVRPIRDDLLKWCHGSARKALPDLFALKHIHDTGAVSGNLRGILYQLLEALGTLPVEGLDIDPGERKWLQASGVTVGQRYLYLAGPPGGRVRPDATRWLAAFWNARHGKAMKPPRPRQVSFKPAARDDGDFCRAIGYPVVGPRAVRVDIVETLIHRLAQNAQPLVPDKRLGTPQDFARIVKALARRPRETLEIQGHDRSSPFAVLQRLKSDALARVEETLLDLGDG